MRTAFQSLEVLVFVLLILSCRPILGDEGDDDVDDREDPLHRQNFRIGLQFGHRGECLQEQIIPAVRTRQVVREVQPELHQVHDPKVVVVYGEVIQI